MGRPQQFLLKRHVNCIPLFLSRLRDPSGTGCRTCRECPDSATHRRLVMVGVTDLGREFAWRNNSGFQPSLRKIPRIESNHEVCFAEFSAQAKRVVLGVGRDLSRGMDFHLFGPLANQIDDFSDDIRTNVEAFQNFLIFIQNVIGYEPDEVVQLGPVV